MQELSAKYGLRVANVFHAGDGNLHPLILYDANKPGELERAEEFGADILRLCVEVGGVLTGEHGVGVEKRDLMPVMFSEIDLNQQQRLKCAFDAKGLLNPGKVLPDVAPLRRARPHARARRQAGVSGYSAVLSGEHEFRHSQTARRPDVEDAIAWALGNGKTLEIVGQGSKRAIGRAAQWDVTLDLSGLRGVTLYEPEELVLSANAGTPLAEIEALVAANGQQLAFEPMDYGPLLGGPAGRGTIGGALAANLSGPRRIKAGAARDHFLGFSRRLRARRDLQVRRPRGEERHRLRPLQASRRLLGHAGGHDRGDGQDTAASRNRGDRSGDWTWTTRQPARR